MLGQFGIGGQLRGRAVDRAIGQGADGTYDLPLAVCPALLGMRRVKRPDPTGAVGLIVDLVLLDPIDDLTATPGAQPATDDAGDNGAGAGLDAQQRTDLGAHRCAGPTADAACTEVQQRSFCTRPIVACVQIGDLCSF